MITAAKLAAQGNELRQIQSDSPLWAIIAKAVGSLHESASNTPPLTREQWLAATADLQGVAQSDLLAFVADQFARTFIRSGSPGLNLPVPEPLLQVETLTASSTRNLADTDHGKTLLAGAVGDITLSAPATLPTGFWCRIVRNAAGNVTVNAAAGATVNSKQGHQKVEHQYAAVEIYKVGASTFILAGDLKA